MVVVQVIYLEVLLPGHVRRYRDQVGCLPY
jgi:hypothetical protein